MAAPLITPSLLKLISTYLPKRLLLLLRTCKHRQQYNAHTVCMRPLQIGMPTPAHDSCSLLVDCACPCLTLQKHRHAAATSTRAVLGTA